MSAARVSSLTIYPVKSLQGMSVSEAVVEPRGLRGDRRFMVVDPAGDFITQRECRKMSRVTASLTEDALILETPGQDLLEVARVPAGTDSGPVRVWSSTVEAVKHDPEADRWLSEALGRAVHLVSMPETSIRPVNPDFDRGSDQVSFADGYPYLVIGDASLEDLNTRLERPVPMLRFRPNITVSGISPYEEDSWGAFQVGGAVFSGVKPCARCVLTTVDPESDERSKEPLATLASYRTHDGAVWFGLNAVPDGGGVIRVGDVVVTR